MAENCVSNDLMVDIGCGSGQSITPWSKVFRKCLGVDVSEAQIDCARKNFADKSNMEFTVCSSDNLPLPDNSVDLVTCAAAWHWLDHSVTIPEIQRVLKPQRGCVAIYSYTKGVLKDPEAEKLFSEFWFGTLGESKSWSEKVEHVYQMYRKLPMVYPTAVNKVFTVEETFSFAEFFGYLGTTSGYVCYKKKYPDSHPLETMEEKMKQLISTDCIEMTTPYFLYLSKNFWLYYIINAFFCIIFLLKKPYSTCEYYEFSKKYFFGLILLIYSCGIARHYVNAGMQSSGITKIYQTEIIL